MKVHEELSQSLAVIKKDNKALVEPVMEKLRQQVHISTYSIYSQRDWLP